MSQDFFTDTELPQTPKSRVIIRISTELNEFRSVIPQFLGELAHALNITEQQVDVINVRSGCTLITIELPEDAAQILILPMQGLPDEVKQVLDKYNVKMRKIAEYDARSFTQIQLREDEQDSGRTVTWLHLSDLHMRADAGAKRFEQNVVLKALKRDLPSLLSQYTPRIEPDYVLFTGDIAFSGQEKEYESAKLAFDALNNTLPKKTEWLFVPGNHDVYWNRVDTDMEYRIRGELSTSKAVLDHLLETAKENDRLSGLARLENYNSFIKTNSFMDGSLANGGYYFAKKVNHSNFTVGFAGLNSAWRSTKKLEKQGEQYDRDIGYLILGEPQMREVTDILHDVDLKVALVHHPIQSPWFKDFDAAIHGPRLAGFHFVLRGHEHLWNAVSTTNLEEGREQVRIAAGALYETLERPINCNAIRVNLDTQEVILFLWHYVTDIDRWVPDTAHLRPNGFKRFKISLHG